MEKPKRQTELIVAKKLFLRPLPENQRHEQALFSS